MSSKIEKLHNQVHNSAGLNRMKDNLRQTAPILVFVLLQILLPFLDVFSDLTCIVRLFCIKKHQESARAVVLGDDLGEKI